MLPICRWCGTETDSNISWGAWEPFCSEGCMDLFIDNDKAHRCMEGDHDCKWKKMYGILVYELNRIKKESLTMEPNRIGRMVSRAIERALLEEK